MAHTFSPEELEHILGKISQLPDGEIPSASLIWRVVKELYNPLQTLGGAGRWNIEGRRVIYCSTDFETAKLEVLQSIDNPTFWPRTGVWSVEVNYHGEGLIDLYSEKNLSQVGLQWDDIISSDIQLTQNITEACVRMGANGLIVPSAITGLRNLVFFLDNLNPRELTTNANIIEVKKTDWQVSRSTLAPKDRPSP